MPKIKLSALVSDMKGKSNGSVFSKNSGGVYFRNNPSGGGKKSAKWDKQKSNFSAISRSWRSLTEIEQQSWIDIVSQYPTKNAFGDVRLPTGFELYCRLNGALQAQNFPLLTTPLSPRSVPSVGYVGINWSEYFQLNPKAMLPMFVASDFSKDVRLVPGQQIGTYGMFRNAFFSFRILLNPKQFQNINSNTTLQFAQFIDNNDYGWFFYVENIALNSFDVVVEFQTPNGVSTFRSTIKENIFSKSFHFGFGNSNNSVTTLDLFVDGVEVTLTNSTSGTPNNLINDFQFSIVNVETYGKCNFFISDVRYYSTNQSAGNALLISQGYVLDTEFIITDCITHTGNVFTNFGIGSTNYDFLYLDELSNSVNLAPASFALIPDFQIEVENAGLSGMYLNVYATPPISWGKTGTTTNLKLLGSFLWDTETTFNVFDQYKTIYGNVPANSND